MHRSKLSGSVKAPPSKSYTHRALVLASMAAGESEVMNPLYCRDTEATLQCCMKLGARVTAAEDITVLGGRLRAPCSMLDAKSSGTTARLITAVASHAAGGFTLVTGSRSLRKRPMGPLLLAIRDLGGRAWSIGEEGRLPVVVEGCGLAGGEAEVDSRLSSQFLSALLATSLWARREVRLKPVGLVSKPYVEMTVHVVRWFGGCIEERSWGYVVPPEQLLKPAGFRVPGDFSLAALLAAAAALTESRVEVKGLSLAHPQGDSAFIQCFRELGVDIECREESIVVQGFSPRAARLNLRDTPDLLPALAVLAAKAPGRTVLEGVKHTRVKESDRVVALASELSKLGAEAHAEEDRLVIEGGELRGGSTLSSWGDHRIAMALVALALSLDEPTLIRGVECIADSYPSFLKDVMRLGGRIEVVR